MSVCLFKKRARPRTFEFFLCEWIAVVKIEKGGIEWGGCWFVLGIVVGLAWIIRKGVRMKRVSWFTSR
jgi:hypothetical protein